MCWAGSRPGLQGSRKDVKRPVDEEAQAAFFSCLIPLVRNPSNFLPSVGALVLSLRASGVVDVKEGLLASNYHPAQPGALVREPLKAAKRGR